ncbi:MAG: LacI family DNA-binding transcriptional regulator [Caldilineaceae bacterium]|nr:LacI family DNA-binding transcriptional regulator [Caldilineaceae bacterium]
MTNASQRITVKDVARLAGVSPGTVSNALSGKRPVSEATRQRVLDAIQELDYQPDLLARSLVSRKSGTLAVVAAGLEYYGPSRTLVGIESQAAALGYSLLLDLLHSPAEEDVESALRMLTARRVDGIIMAIHDIGANHDWVTVERLTQLPPMVFLTMQKRAGISILSANSREGGKLATEHLLALGRKRIGIVTGPMTWWEARERLAGWEEAMHHAGLEPSPSLIEHGDWLAASGEVAVKRLLARHPDLDAVFANNDQMALGVLRAANALGISIPGDLAVVGYDNIPESAYFWPSLTTVRQFLTAVGEEAVRTLHDMVETRVTGGTMPQPLTQVLNPQLIVRESTAGTNSGHTAANITVASVSEASHRPS